jgi:hypothetical protein
MNHGPFEADPWASALKGSMGIEEPERRVREYYGPIYRTVSPLRIRTCAHGHARRHRSVRKCTENLPAASDLTVGGKEVSLSLTSSMWLSHHF